MREAASSSLAEHPSENAPVTRPASEVSARYRILVVDDDPETATLVRTWFEGQPYDVLAAHDAAAGIDAAARERPDVILLDLRMPGMDGIAAARRLKAAPVTRPIPLILLTACREVSDKVEAFAAGADDYVTKPFHLEEVDARIRAILKRRESIAQLEHRILDLSVSNEQLEEMLTVDEKTGLANYREFRKTLRAEWQRAERYGTDLSLVMLDLDDFKGLNDTYGHPAGDRAIWEFALLVGGGARSTDVAARFGGEEFAVVLPHTNAAMAARVAERIRMAVKEFVFLDGEHPTRLTVSGGVATFPSFPDIASADDLLRAADRALYRAKLAGKDRVLVHDDSLT